MKKLSNGKEIISYLYAPSTSVLVKTRSILYTSSDRHQIILDSSKDSM